MLTAVAPAGRPLMTRRIAAMVCVAASGAASACGAGNQAGGYGQPVAGPAAPHRARPPAPVHRSARAHPRPGPGAVALPSLARQLGQRLMVSMDGIAPTAALLARARAGQIGGVILMGDDAAHATASTHALQRAAREGHNPPLLIATDQEGGLVARLPHAPPGLSAAAMGELPPNTVRMLGRRTALAMRRLGINVDLAPVADVPSSPAAFIAKTDRGFSRDPGRVARAATAFARGLRDGGVLATAKHFPGLGAATVNTDAASVTLTATARDIAPFQALIAADVPLIMLSNAAYTNLGSEPASRSARVVGLLRGTYRFRGVTITDALRPATTTSALRSVQARADIVLAITDERQSAAICRAMVAAAMHGEIPTQQLRRSYARIASLKRSAVR